MSLGHFFLFTLIIAGANLLTRALPFFIFHEGRTIPPLIEYLGSVLPAASMGLLVIYALKDVSWGLAREALPAILASLLVVLLQLKKHNTMLSILGGTLAYMILLRLF